MIQTAGEEAGLLSFYCYSVAVAITAIPEAVLAVDVMTDATLPSLSS